MLIVADRIERTDDAGPLSGRNGNIVRRAVDASSWGAGVVYDAAVRCPAAPKAAQAAVAECRPYLAQTVAKLQPSRIVVLGTTAAEAVLGRPVDTASARRGYAWLPGLDIPVLFVRPLADAVRNRLYRQELMEDMEWAATVQPERPPLTDAAILVRTARDALEAEAHLRAGLAFDTETCGTLHNSDFRLLCLAASSLADDRCWVWDAAALASPDTRAPLERLITDPAIPVVAHNAKYDSQAVWCAEGWLVRGLARDTMMWRKLQQGDVRVGLDLCAELVGMGGHKGEAHAHVAEAVKAIRKEQRAGVGPTGDPYAYAYARVPIPTLLRYCARDTVATSRLDRWLRRELAGTPQERVWDRVILGATEALTTVELTGAPIDASALDALDAHLTAEMASLEHIWQSLGLDNPASSQQVAALLYDRLGLECPALTATGARSTSQAALEALKGKHTVVDALLRHRKLAKIHGTYCVGMRGHLREDGRIHTSYLLHGTETGRLSSREPNLQNIPRADTPEGKMAKDCFRASPGWKLVQLDYSQLELRVAAMLSGDAAMQAIFASGEDYHMRTAQMIAPHAWGVPEDMWSGLSPDDKKRYRTAAKAVNFGLLYGSGDYALSLAIGCSKQQAGRIRRSVLGQFSALDKWIKERLAYARTHGETWTWWDGQPARRRPLLGIGEPMDGTRGTAERGSWNTAVQGTGSEFCLASLAEIVRWIAEDCVPARVVLTVHDSIVIEARADAVDEVVAVARDIMEGWPSNGVHLAVDAEVGQSWGSLKPY